MLENIIKTKSSVKSDRLNIPEHNMESTESGNGKGHVWKVNFVKYTAVSHVLRWVLYFVP